jgi:hypothetical protein
MVKLHGQHVHPLFIAVPVFIGSCGYESIPINTIYSGMNIHELAAIECCSPGFWHVLTHIHTSIHPYTSIYIPYIYIIYISFLLWTYHFCCLNPPFNDRVLRRAPTRWCRRCSRSMAGGPEPMRPDHLARKQALRLRALWGTKITWWLVEILESWANVQFLGAFFLEKSASIGRFLIFFRRWRSLNGSKRRIWAAGWKLARNYKNQFWTSQSDDISENIQIGEIYLLY